MPSLVGAPTGRSMEAVTLIVGGDQGSLPSRQEPTRRIRLMDSVYKGGALGLIVGTFCFLGLIFIALLRGGSSTCILNKPLLDSPISKRRECQLSVPFILIVEIAFTLMGGALGGLRALFLDGRRFFIETV